MFLNTSGASGSFVAAPALGGAPTLYTLAADTDLDGDADVVAVNASGAHQVYENTAGSGGGLVLHPRQLASPGALGAAAGSLGTDERLDLAVVGGGGVAVFYNDGSGNLGLGDTEPPTIRLVGEAEVDVTVDSEYTDAGATASDAVDGDVTDRIVVDNPVDTDAVGTYTVRYTVTDLSGNAAAPVTRTVTVGARESAGGGGGGAVAWTWIALLAAAAAARAAGAARVPRVR